MINRIRYGIILMSIFTISSCATVTKQPAVVEAPVSRKEQQEAQIEQMSKIPEVKRYKRKIAIARFTNETNYGRALLTDEEYDRMGKQASDMLMSRLIQSNNFLVFERPDLSNLKKEQDLSKDVNLIGVDVLIVGSVTEFGRSVGGKSGFLSHTKVQTAKSKVDIRLIDVKTGHAYFSAIGSGEASTESGEVAGFGSRAAYDSTLNDNAIAAAITDVVDELISKLDERPWRTDILEVQGNQVFISGGKTQGIRIGDTLKVMQRSKVIKSEQTGFDIELPPIQVGELKVEGFFGDNETNEGSICNTIDGDIDRNMLSQLFITEGDKI